MSRLAKKPIVLPKGVEAKLDGRNLSVKGPRGQLTFELMENIEVVIQDGSIEVKAGENLSHLPFLGLNCARIANAVTGVSTGFEKKLQLIGVGFKAAVKGKDLDLSLGFSHPNIMPIPEGIEIKVDKNTLIIVSGIDKQKVGQFAAQVRALRPPEPYKGKGVRYEDEVVRRKAGKSAK